MADEMENCEASGPGPKKRGLKVDLCKGIKMSEGKPMTKWNVKLKKKKPEPEIEELPDDLTNENVRDLNRKSGEPANTKTDYSSMSTADKQARIRQEKALTKSRTYFGR